MGDAPASRWSRRKFLRRALAAGSAAFAGVALYAWRIEPHWVTITEHELPLHNLPDAWEGRTIVQISDLHVGPVVDEHYLRRALQQVNALKPEMIVITGDLMTCDGPSRISQAAGVIAELETPPRGLLVVLGNHDYGEGCSDTRAADGLVRAISDVGATVLRNETRTIDGLQFVGTDELWAARCDVPRALAAYDPARPAIALIHNPDVVEMPEWSDGPSPFRGWFLAGHTHGGQVDPPLFRPPLLPVHRRDRFAGRYDLAPGRTLYINRGLGYLKRVRLGCRPEITRFTLTTPQAAS